MEVFECKISEYLVTEVYSLARTVVYGVCNPLKFLFREDSASRVMWIAHYHNPCLRCLVNDVWQVELIATVNIDHFAEEAVSV